MSRKVRGYWFSLLIVVFCPLVAQSATKVKSSKVYSVTNSSKIYKCYKLNGKAKFVLKKSSKYILGNDAIAALKAEMKQTHKEKDKKKLKELSQLKSKVNTGNYACLHPNSGGGSGGTTLTKLQRPLTREDIQYLLDKAALGLSSREESLVNIGLTKGIDALVDELTKTHTEPTGLMDRVLDWRDGQLGSSATQSPSGQRKALLDLWINTNNPYHEKLALFLLSVWTVSGDVISDETFRAAFWDYYSRLRDYAYSNGELPDLALAITRDPLMLIYLNNELNVKGSPNENYARELMELFTLGPTDGSGNPNYTETKTDGSGDIAVAAKMLTGYKVNSNYQTNKLDVQFLASRHQSGPHTMFAGKSYQFSGDDDEDLVLGIFANHPQVKNYYAREILKVYLTPNPPEALVESFGDVIKSHNYRLNEAMKILLASEVFYNSDYRDTVPMNSFEFAAKSARLLELYNSVNAAYAENQIIDMGFQLNQAPSVFWYNQDVWSSPSVILEKANYLALIMSDHTAQSNGNWTPAKVLPSGAASVSEVIEATRKRVGLGELSASYYDQLNGYMTKSRQYDDTYLSFSYNNNNTTHQATKGLGLYYILFMTPEFNLL